MLRMCSVRKGASCVQALRGTARLAAVAARRVPACAWGQAAGPGARRLVLGATSLGLALLAADHLFNGQSTIAL